MLFTDKLSDRTRAVDSMLCVGLDPDFARIPEHLKGEEDPVWAFCRAIVDATAPFVCAFKPQIAYFAAMGAEKTLERVIAYIHEKHPDIPVILDAKRGDIGSTARQYAKEAFVRYKADAVTVSPYMGYDTITPYLEYQDKGVIILCRTSNPGGADIEELVCDGEMIYERIARLAFEYAKKTGKNRVSCVTKANIIKTTDGKFLDTCQKVAQEYPEVVFDDWYIDIMTAKLLDDKRRRDFKVVVLPNLYGDIITDEAAEIQGGVGTAGSANIGKRYAMFEAIHGSAPRMVQEGRAKYADPSSVLRASVMLLEHIGEIELANKLDRALDICMFEEKKVVVTGRDTGATAQEFTDYVLDTIAKL